MRLLLLIKTKNNQKYNSILTIIYYVIKYILFIFIQDDIIAADFTKLFFEHIKYHFNFSRNIIINRDSYIILDF